MLVEFKATWFSPTEPEVKAKFGKTGKVFHVSGRRYKKGVHQVPDYLKPFLPSSAKVLDKEPEEKKEEEAPVLRDLDHFRAEEDSIAEVHKLADEALEKRKNKKKEK